MRTVYNRGLLGYNENYSSGNYNAFYIDLALKLDNLMTYMTFYEGIVFCKIYILKYPAGLQSSDSDARILRFIDNVMQHYHSRWRFPRQVCIRARSSMGHHYHLMFLIDPKKDPKRCDFLKKANEIWQACLGVKGDQDLVHLMTTVGERSSFTDFKLLEDKDSFPSYFVKLIQVAKFYAECDDKTKLPVGVKRF